MNEQEIINLFTEIKGDMKAVTVLLLTIILLIVGAYFMCDIIPTTVYHIALTAEMKKDFKKWKKERLETFRKEFNEKWREDNVQK